MKDDAPNQAGKKLKDATWPEKHVAGIGSHGDLGAEIVVAPAKKKPFQNCKPRDQWRPPKRKLRVFADVCVGQRAGEDEWKLFEFSLSGKGLTVRRKHGRKAGARTWSFAELANGKSPTGQVEMFLPKAKGKL